MRKLQGIGFLMVLVCSTGLDGTGWVTALWGCAVGAMLMIVPMVAKKARALWIA